MSLSVVQVVFSLSISLFIVILCSNWTKVVVKFLLFFFPILGLMICLMESFDLSVPVKGFYQVPGDDYPIRNRRQNIFAAAILAMRHPRRLVLAGCLSALIVMTIFSALVGWAAPNLISRKWTHHITTILFLGFGLWSLWDAFHEGESEELAEVEAQLDADLKANGGVTKENKKDDDHLKKQRQPFLAQFFSPILLKAFSITFFGEWGDKSQLATIGLAADENPFGVVLGGIIGQALCTTAAVLGGKSLAKQISEKFVALSGGVLFIVFGIQSFLSPIDS